VATRLAALSGRIMNVLCVTNFYPIPATPARGIFVRRQVRALTRRGLSMTVVHPLPHVLPGAARLVERAAQFADLPLHYTDDEVDVYQPRYFTWPGHLVVGMSDLFQYGPVRRLGLQRPDLVHAHFAAPSGLLARRLAEHWDVPFVLSLRGYDTNFWPHHHVFNRRRFRSVCRAANRVLAASDDLAKKAASIADVHPEVLTTGIDLSIDMPLPARDLTRQRLGLDADAFLVVFVGNHIRHKGMEELLQVAASRPDVRFVTAGIGPWRERLSALGNISTLGQVPGEEIAGLMAAADVLCLPSYSEGMPNVVLEAGAYGLPVVATDVGGIPEVLGGNERGLMVPAGDAEALGMAIDAVRRDPTAAAMRAGALRERVRTHFDADVLAERLAAIYQEVMDGAVVSK